MPIVSFDCSSSSALSSLLIDTDNNSLYIEYRENNHQSKYAAALSHHLTNDLMLLLKDPSQSKGELISSLKSNNFISLIPIDELPIADTYDSIDTTEKQYLGGVLDNDNDVDEGFDVYDEEVIDDGNADVESDDDGGDEGGPGDDDVDGEKKLEDKEFACSYCGLADTQAVVKSLDDKGGGRWFCNGNTTSIIITTITTNTIIITGRGHSSASHIVQHLVKSKNKVVQLHEDSAMGDITLECYNCGQKVLLLLLLLSLLSTSIVTNITTTTTTTITITTTNTNTNITTTTIRMFSY